MRAIAPVMGEILADQCAVITGGSSGIGREIAVRYAEHGADVVIADIRNEPRKGGVSTEDRIANETDSASKFVQCDVSKRDDVNSAVEEADKFGGIDIMVNNAGVLVQEPFLEFDDSLYDRIMDVNVKGTFLGSQIAARRMAENGSGSIVNMSSVSGLSGAGGRAVYCASKGAVRLLTYALADTLGPMGIRVNAIHPGVIDTAQAREDSKVIGDEDFLSKIPLNRFGDPGDIADAALYLASDFADYVNGTSLVVDGGRYTSG